MPSISCAQMTTVLSQLLRGVLLGDRAETAEGLYVCVYICLYVDIHIYIYIYFFFSLVYLFYIMPAKIWERRLLLASAMI